VAYLFTSIATPVLSAVLRPLTWGLTNYVPAGPTAIIFAVLAQYHAMVPHMYKYRIATSAAPPTDDEFKGVTLSDKSYRYALALHLSLLQWPGSVLAAFVGWIVGYSYREGILPAGLISWRLPGWVLGLKSHRSRSEFEGLRRRLEGQGDAATASGAQGPQAQGAGEAGRRRTMGQQFMSQIREAL
jgi:hypothetical protein